MSARGSLARAARLASVLLAPAALCLAGCVTAPTLEESRLIDLTHGVDGDSPTPPGVAPLAVQRAFAPAGERWSVSARFDVPDRSGAYLQAPLAFAEGRRSVDDFTPAQWIGPVRMLDVARACSRDRDHLAGIDDLRAHERMHGRIPRGAAVLIRTGWDGRWATRERYFGIAQDLSAHYPGISVELARELIERGVDLVGIDGPDLDGGLSFERETSRAFAAANVPVLGNLAGLGDLPPIGATLIAAPLKVRESPSAPVRVFAILP